jgi:hypothetical protein
MRYLAGAAVIVLAACGSSSAKPAAPAPTTAIGSLSRTERELPAPGPTDPAYRLLAAGRCKELLARTKSWGPAVAAREGASTPPLYMSAAYACLGRWNDAKRTFAAINLNAPQFTKSAACPRAAVLQWMVGLLDQRNQDPTFAPKFVPSTSRSTCEP